MSIEAARAFLEDLEFMLDTGESMATAATRFGCTLNTLEKRADRARKTLRDEAVTNRIQPVIAGRISSGAEMVEHPDADPQLVLAERG